MAQDTKIEWADHTWSPWEGCTRVSITATGGGGCDNCYAERMNRWLHRGENWGPGAPRLEFSDDHWDKLRRWNDRAAKRSEQPKVFPSMCDPLDNEVHAGLRDRFWRAIENTPSLTWLVLTKRIGNAQKMLPQAWLKNRWPTNLWLGATVVNQAEADRDVPKLLVVPARVRFLSIEPMLGPVDLERVLWPNKGGHRVDVLRGGYWNKAGILACGPSAELGEPVGGFTNHSDFPGKVDWVICGGESGPHARPMHPEWARSLRDQCAEAGVPFLFKQHGEWIGVPDLRRLPGGGCPGFGAFDHCKLDMRHEAVRVGKKAAGRLLDGVEHNEFPGAPA